MSVGPDMTNFGLPDATVQESCALFGDQITQYRLQRQYVDCRNLQVLPVGQSQRRADEPLGAGLPPALKLARTIADLDEALQCSASIPS